MLNTVSKGNRGFTLIELLVVIVILAILASMAIPNYMKYKNQFESFSYAKSIAESCLAELISYCVENPGVAINPVVGADSPAVNCRYDNKDKKATTTGGKVGLEAKGTLTCGSDGTLNFGTASDGNGIVATLESVNNQQARCFAVNNYISCVIEAK